MSTPESKIKAKVMRLLSALPDKEYYHFFPATGGYGKSGVPDIVVCIGGSFLGIECKAGKNKPTALQLKALHAIRDAGGYAIVVNEHTDWVGLQSLLETLTGNERAAADFIMDTLFALPRLSVQVQAAGVPEATKRTKHTRRKT